MTYVLIATAGATTTPWWPAEVYEFLTWQGWSGVSAIAQIVALVTLIGAAWRFILQRRQMPLFAFDWIVIGTTKVDGKIYHVVQFHNIGRGSGVIHMLEFFGAGVHLNNDYLAPRVLGPGQSFRLLLTAPQIAEVWFRTTVRTDDRTRVVLAWHALSRGALDDQQSEEDNAWGWWARLRQLVSPKAVGPGFAPRGVIHAGRRNEVQRLRGDFVERAQIYSLGTLHNGPAKDLPFYRGVWDRDPDAA